MSAPPLARRAALVTVLVAGAAVLAVGAVTVPWHWVPGGRLVPVSARSLFTAAQIDRAQDLSSARRLLGWSSYAVSSAVLLVLGLTPAGARLLRRVTPSRWWLAVPVGTAVVLLLVRVTTLPFAVAGQRLELRFDLSRQPWSGWVLDEATSLAVSWAATSLALLVVVGLARRAPRWWFAWAGVVSLLLVLAGSYLYPVVVEPLFNRFTPMAPGPVRDSIFALARRDGVHIDDVLVADASRRTTTLNAYVSGFGDTRRVVVYDNTLRDLTPEQTRVVIAHELGHAKDHDVLLGTGLGAGGAVAGVALLALLLDSRAVRRRSGTTGPADPGVVALVLALFTLATFAVSPLQNTVSRAMEARADRTAIETTHADAAFVAMQRQLALRSLADPDPPRWSQLWWGTHPTVLQRAGLPESLRRAGR